MRKIENVQGFNDYLIDLIEKIRKSMRSTGWDVIRHFGLSRDGENVDGKFSTRFDIMGEIFRVGSVKKTPPVFLEEVLSDYCFPFYIVYTGEEKSWI